jgi:formiminoglutamase
MDLTIFFSPVDESLFSDLSSVSCFYKSLRIFSEKMPDYKGAHMAIIGIGEARGNKLNEGTSQGPDEVRKKLYQLKRGTGNYRIVDLGNLNVGHDLAETYTRLSEVCRILLENNVLPIIIGGSQDLDYGQYAAYETLEKLVSFLNVDALLDLEDKTEETLKIKPKTIPVASTFTKYCCMNPTTCSATHIWHIKHFSLTPFLFPCLRNCISRHSG